ncbi:MAG: nitroreductase family protein [Victivallales bacterium]|nr:nitroreductase family protein [Victivallales bacterium]
MSSQPNPSKLLSRDALLAWRDGLRTAGKRLVVTNGVFDILHCGHVQYLEQARALGDELLVCLNGDEGVHKLKGPTRPINDQVARAAVLSGLACVSAVYIFDGVKATAALADAQPDVYVKGGDYTLDTLDREEYAVLQQAGSVCQFIPFVGNYSTTNTLRKIQGNSTNADNLGTAASWPPALNHLCNRRSIRAYQPRPVSRDLLTSLLQAAMAAPSACNCNPWRFLVLTEHEALTRLASCLPRAPFLPSASAAVIVCGDLEKAHAHSLSYLLQDCSAAMENLLLAASALNLGACWLGVHPVEERISAIREMFRLPENLIPVGAASIGWPAEEKPARTKFRDEDVTWNPPLS